ncbi:hypothetical protein H2509_12790 [Stappia sp. F7233]|uniref:HAD family hydrolase n=1 Tax=Stappia albiluteola TaxID=2758565 RepID=A0A839AEJ9_9HYPH|nr:hypothetical protein [Stappia albiluteola]MBA5778001.1 hypothetical protein [Stappia albiluteola]
MAEPHPVEPATLTQISVLPKGTRPLIVCDIDEVVLHFIPHLEEYIGQRGYRFDSHVYKLIGNISALDGSPANDETVRSMIQGFFDAHAGEQRLVDGAADSLNALSEFADIVLLTNLPGGHNKPVRTSLLERNGISFPLVTNRGPKGGAVAALAAGRREGVIFIDDSPSNLRSVRASLANAVLIQFIADARFLATAEPLEGLGLKTNDWHQTRTYIEGVLGG